MLSQMRVPHFLLLAATDPCGPEYLDRLSSDMMRRTLVGVKGAEENVRFLEEVVRLAHAGRPKPEGVPVFVLDDNVKHLRLKLSDSGGWRSAVDLTNIQFKRFLATAFDTCRKEKVPIFSCARYPNALYGKAAATDRCHLSRSFEAGSLFKPSFDAHVYGAAFGLLTGAAEEAARQVSPTCASMVGDLERGLRNYLQDEKCLFFPSVAVSKMKMAGGSGRLRASARRQTLLQVDVFRRCLRGVAADLRGCYLNLMRPKRWAKAAVLKYEKEVQRAGTPRKRHIVKPKLRRRPASSTWRRRS
jgi:hypothetical protein